MFSQTRGSLASIFVLALAACGGDGGEFPDGFVPGTGGGLDSDAGQQNSQGSAGQGSDAGKACDLTKKTSGAQPDARIELYSNGRFDRPLGIVDKVECGWDSSSHRFCDFYSVVATYPNDRGWLVVNFAKKPTEGAQTWPVHGWQVGGGGDGVSIYLNNGKSRDGIGTVTTTTTSGKIVIRGEGVGLEFDGYNYKGDTLSFNLTAE